MISLSLQLGFEFKISGKGEGAGRWGSLTLGKKWFWKHSAGFEPSWKSITFVKK
jgi:hypothetical protein